jgi:signal transduction histidine kinase
MRTKLFNGDKPILQNGDMAATVHSPIHEIKNTAAKYIYPSKPFTETINNGFFTVNRKWTVTYWNKASEELLGVKAKDVVGKNLWEEFAAIIPLNFYAVYQNAFLQDIPVHFQEYWAEKGCWFDVITYHYNDMLSVSFKSCSRPSDLLSAEQQLKKLNQLYKFVTEVTNDCLWEWDLQNKQIFWIDGGHKRVFGYPVENAIIPQVFWESRIHPDDKDRILVGLNKIIKEGIECIWQDEYRFKNVNGEYTFVHDKGYLIYLGNVPSRMIGATQDITERKLLEAKLAKERLQKQKEITEAILTAQENERAAIGRELHENINQLLSVAKMYLLMAQKDKKIKQIYLKDSCNLLQNAMDEIRKISKHLVIPDKHFAGLTDNIKNLIADLKKVHPLKINFITEHINEEMLDDKIETNIFRIVQEQTNNIVKHSQATKASIKISINKDEIILLITDNGIGFNTADKINGVGLKNIISRAELCNGKATIESTTGKGFQLKVILPLVIETE